MIKVGQMALGMYQTNCYFLHKEGSSDTIVFDPADSGDYIFDSLKKNGLNVKAIVLTHGHFDHIYGVNKLRELSGAKVYSYIGEAKLLEDENLNCSVSVGRPAHVACDEYLHDGEDITFADMTFKTLYTPGHTEGSACYYFEEDKLLIAGDTLFCESIGRSDLPTGSGKTLINSITEKLMVLPDDVTVYPGHGESTTIGNERAYNPFLN